MTTSDQPASGIGVQDWDNAKHWDAYFATVKAERELWETSWKDADVDEESAARLAALPDRRRVLVLTADWCGDAARTVPVLAKAFSAAPLVDARYLSADAAPHALSRHLTHGARAIPIVVVEDDLGRELGVWGPRPAPLQAIFRARVRALGEPTDATRAAFDAPLVRWYAKDGGRTALAEVLMVLERGGTPR
jgi:hypothetical protein